MSIGLALIVVGVFDALVAALMTPLLNRAAELHASWPDPGPFGSEKATWDALATKLLTMRVVRIVCLNTGGSFVSAGLLLLVGLA